MTELQSSQRRSYTAKTIFGLLLAVVMVAAFATAGSAISAERRTTPRHEGVLSVLRPPRWVLHDHRVEPERDRQAGMHVVYTDPTFVGHDLSSHLYVDGPGNNDAYGHVVLHLPPDPTAWTGQLTFSGGTGRFSGFHANVFVDCTAALVRGTERTTSPHPATTRSKRNP